LEVADDDVLHRLEQPGPHPVLLGLNLINVVVFDLYEFADDRLVDQKLRPLDHQSMVLGLTNLHVGNDEVERILPGGGQERRWQ
jgi:hypothetical protein